MDKVWTGVFVLFVLVVPVSSEGFFTDPVICYFLDGFLVIYCLTATALYFREKFSFIPSALPNVQEDGGIYQELERPKDTDPYQVLEPLKKKKAGKKKKTKSAKPEDKDKDPFESLKPTASPPTLSPKLYPARRQDMVAEQSTV